MPKFHWFDAAKLHNYLNCSYFYEYIFHYGGGMLVGGEVILLSFSKLLCLFELDYSYFCTITKDNHTPWQATSISFNISPTNALVRARLR
jgi:hypothetical protein